MLVKICGLSNRIDAQTAVECGADALGFVMGGKILPVEVEPLAQHVRQWIRELPKRADSFIVSHFLDVAELLALAEYVNSAGIQVSENLTGEHMQELRRKTKKKIIKTIPVDGEWSFRYMEEVQPYADFLLLDSVSAGYIGGTGKPNNWQQCSELVKAAKKPVYIAGGLTPDNIAHAMQITAPQGVDVATGVSTYCEEYLRKDRKDPAKIRRFIDLAKGKSH